MSNKEDFLKKLADFQTKLESYASNNNFNISPNEIEEVVNMPKSNEKEIMETLNKLGELIMKKEAVSSEQELSGKAKELKQSIAEMQDVFNVLKPVFAKDDKDDKGDKGNGEDENKNNKDIHPEEKKEKEEEEDEDDDKKDKKKKKKYLKKIVTKKEEAMAALEDDLKNGFIDNDEFEKVSQIIGIADSEDVGEIFGEYASKIELRASGGDEDVATDATDKNTKEARDNKMDQKKLAERKEFRRKIMAGFQSEGVDAVPPSSYEQHDWFGKNIKVVEKEGVANIDGYEDTASKTQQKIEKEHGVYRQGDDRYRTASSVEKIVRLAADDVKFIEAEKQLDKLATALDESLESLKVIADDEALKNSFGENFDAVYANFKEAASGAKEGVAAMSRGRMEEDKEIRAELLEKADAFMKSASAALDDFDKMFVEARKSNRMEVLAVIKEDEKIAQRAEFDSFVGAIKSAKADAVAILKRASEAKAKAFSEKKRLHGLKLAGTDVNKDDLELAADVINQLIDIESKAGSIRQALDNAEVRLDIKAMDEENLKSAMNEFDAVVKEASDDIYTLNEALDIIEKEPEERMSIRKDASWRTKVADYKKGLGGLKTDIAGTLTDMKHLFTIIDKSKPLYSERRQENLEKHQTRLASLASDLLVLDEQIGDISVNISDDGIKTASIESRGDIAEQIEETAVSVLDKIAETKSEMDDILQYSEGIATTLDAAAEAEGDIKEAGSMPPAAMEALKKYREGKGKDKKDKDEDKDDKKKDKDEDDDKEEKDDDKEEKDDDKEDDDDKKEKKEAGSIPAGLREYLDKKKKGKKDKEEDDDKDDKKKDKKEDKEDDDDKKKDKKKKKAVCGGCGIVVLAEDRFCESCGARFSEDGDDEDEGEGESVEEVEACTSEMEAEIDAQTGGEVAELSSHKGPLGGSEAEAEAEFAGMDSEGGKKDKPDNDNAPETEEPEAEEPETEESEDDNEDDVEGQTCSECKTSVAKKANFCSSCGIKVAAKKSKKDKKDKKKDKKEDKKEKKELEKDEKAEDDDEKVEAAYACGNCNHVVASTATECQHCGATFQTKTAGVDKQTNFTPDVMTEQEKHELTEDTITKLPTDVRDVVAKIIEERNQLKAKFAAEQKKVSDQKKKNDVTAVINTMVEKGLIASDNRESQKSKAKELFAMSDESFSQFASVIGDAPIQKKAISKNFEKSASAEEGALTMPLILETTEEEMKGSGLDFLADEWTTPVKKANYDYQQGLVKKANDIKEYEMF